MNHLMIDLLTISTPNLNAPLLAIEAVFFEPSTGHLGASFYTTVDIRKNPEMDGDISIRIAFDWMKKDADWRAEVLSAEQDETEALLALDAFVANNTKRLSAPLVIYLKDASLKFDDLRHAFAFVFEDLESPLSGIEHISPRCITSLLDIAYSIGYLPHPRNDRARYTLTDARYQTEQVCEIWQRLTSPHLETL
ncbi:TPA: 3'-5' exonuclease [Klebsiella michiganensis]